MAKEELTVEAVIELARGATPEEFVARLGKAVLVAPPSKHPGADLGDEDKWTYNTAVASSAPGEGPMTTFRESRVIPIRKARPGPFANTVLVGRAASNDICLTDESISKLHARIRMEPPDELHLSDAGSRNGTRVNGRRLASGESALLRHGDDITFGDRTYKLYTTERLQPVFRGMQ